MAAASVVYGTDATCDLAKAARNRNRGFRLRAAVAALDFAGYNIFLVEGCACGVRACRFCSASLRYFPGHF